MFLLLERFKTSLCDNMVCVNNMTLPDLTVMGKFKASSIEALNSIDEEKSPVSPDPANSKVPPLPNVTNTHNSLQKPSSPNKPPRSPKKLAPPTLRTSTNGGKPPKPPKPPNLMKN